MDVFVNKECDSLLLYMYGTNRINLTLVYIFFPIRKILILSCHVLNKFYSRLVLPKDLLHQNLIA